jgi:protein-L-isoaspartate(D-aspartate) O-methyltransferase
MMSHGRVMLVCGAMVTAVMALLSGLACRAEQSTTAPSDAEGQHERARAEMVRTQLAERDITDQRVLEAMRRVPRHRFVPAEHAADAYGDHPLPIGHDQTISQPYIVALMTQLARVKAGDQVLDIGTGSGYQAAVLAEMGAKVASIEIVPALAEEARARLTELGYDVEVRAGDGFRGWPERAPFQAMILAAATPEIPQPLIEQLAPGGRLVLPVGGDHGQQLLVITRQPDGSVHRETVVPVRFVPMTGEVRQRDR